MWLFCLVWQSFQSSFRCPQNVRTEDDWRWYYWLTYDFQSSMAMFALLTLRLSCWKVDLSARGRIELLSLNRKKRQIKRTLGRIQARGDEREGLQQSLAIQGRHFKQSQFLKTSPVQSAIRFHQTFLSSITFVRQTNDRQLWPEMSLQVNEWTNERKKRNEINLSEKKSTDYLTLNFTCCGRG